MSLSYELGNIRGWKALIDEESGEWAITQGVIFATISTGIGKITEDNAPEFFARCRIVDLVIGETHLLTAKDIERRIGLVTNVAYESRTKWLKRISRHVDDFIYEYKRELKKGENDG